MLRKLRLKLQVLVKKPKIIDVAAMWSVKACVMDINQNPVEVEFSVFSLQSEDEPSRAEKIRRLRNEFLTLRMEILEYLGGVRPGSVPTELRQNCRDLSNQLQVLSRVYPEAYNASLS